MRRQRSHYSPRGRATPGPVKLGVLGIPIRDIFLSLLPLLLVNRSLLKLLLLRIGIHVSRICPHGKTTHAIDVNGRAVLVQCLGVLCSHYTVGNCVGFEFRRPLLMHPIFKTGNLCCKNLPPLVVQTHVDGFTHFHTKLQA